MIIENKRYPIHTGYFEPRRIIVSDQIGVFLFNRDRSKMVQHNFVINELQTIQPKSINAIRCITNIIADGVVEPVNIQRIFSSITYSYTNHAHIIISCLKRCCFVTMVQKHFSICILNNNVVDVNSNRQMTQHTICNRFFIFIAPICLLFYVDLEITIGAFDINRVHLYQRLFVQRIKIKSCDIYFSADAIRLFFCPVPGNILIPGFIMRMSFSFESNISSLNVMLLLLSGKRIFCCFICSKTLSKKIKLPESTMLAESIFNLSMDKKICESLNGGLLLFPVSLIVIFPSIISKRCKFSTFSDCLIVL